MINIILSGGSGTRLWPLSRTKLPKQFVKLFGGKSLFQKTVSRNHALCESSVIVSNVEQYFLAVNQLEDTTHANHQFILESIGRNTAPAIALACFWLNPNDVVLVTPSDHLIKDEQSYHEAITEAKRLAEQDYLVTLGIQPTGPDTGFGYIEADGENVLSFKEKPNLESARHYVDSGNYFWNSGMFCFKAGVFLEELQAYAPKIYQTCHQAYQLALSNEQPNEIRVPLDAMQAIPSDSIDYAVMEHSSRIKVVPCNIGWSDLGSFDALHDVLKDSENNTVLNLESKSLEPICLNATNNLIINGDRQIAVLGLDDVLIVDNKDALLIARQGHSQAVKKIVEQLKSTQPELTDVHRLVHRPWGTYEVLLDAKTYKIKRIVVYPGGRLSLQKHAHRNEHWVVVFGTATVTKGEKTFSLLANQSTYIEMGQLHRLENQTEEDLIMIEVQVGEYTGEDDIVRVEDVYGR